MYPNKPNNTIHIGPVISISPIALNINPEIIPNITNSNA